MAAGSFSTSLVKLLQTRRTSNYTLNVYPGKAYIIGASAGGNWDDEAADWAMTPPADQTGEWVSPAFGGDGELRAYIKIPELDWWRTEFTIYQGRGILA